MRTIGRKVKRGSKAVCLCDHCGTRWYRDQLYRDGAGMLTCPQEGRGRDAVTLTKANVESAKAAARANRTEKGDVGRFDRDTAEPIPGLADE